MNGSQAVTGGATVVGAYGVLRVDGALEYLCWALIIIVILGGVRLLQKVMEKSSTPGVVLKQKTKPPKQKKEAQAPPEDVS